MAKGKESSPQIPICGNDFEVCSQDCLLRDIVAQKVRENLEQWFGENWHSDLYIKNKVIRETTSGRLRGRYPDLKKWCYRRDRSGE